MCLIIIIFGVFNFKLYKMKKILFITFLFTSLFMNAQDDIMSKAIKKTESSVTSLKYTVNSTEDIETFKWDEVKSFFENNKADQVIELGFKIDLKESKNKFKGSFVVSGESKNIDSLTIKANKMLQGLIKISKKHEN